MFNTMLITSNLSQVLSNGINIIFENISYDDKFTQGDGFKLSEDKQSIIYTKDEPLDIYQLNIEAIYPKVYYLDVEFHLFKNGKFMYPLYPTAVAEFMLEINKNDTFQIIVNIKNVYLGVKELDDLYANYVSNPDIGYITNIEFKFTALDKDLEKNLDESPDNIVSNVLEIENVGYIEEEFDKEQWDS